MITNAEKYLKDENYKKTLWYDFKNWCNETKINCPYGIAFEEFMNQPVKPTLTEDERVILKQVSKAYVMIGKNGYGRFIFRIDNGEPFLLNNTAEKIFNGLFQFIKERRRI